jgi:hypothetical protein
LSEEGCATCLSAKDFHPFDVFRSLNLKKHRPKQCTLYVGIARTSETANPCAWQSQIVPPQNVIHQHTPRSSCLGSIASQFSSRSPVARVPLVPQRILTTMETINLKIASFTGIESNEVPRMTKHKRLSVTPQLGVRLCSIANEGRRRAHCWATAISSF